MIAGIVSAQRVAAGGGGTSVTRWRIYVTAVDGGTAVSINEVEFRAIAGGADLCTGGTPSASTQFDATRAPRFAFDDITSSTAEFWGSEVGLPQWLRYDLPTAAGVNQITIQARNDGNTFGQSPADFTVQSSVDGTTWLTEWTVTGSAGWAAGETRTFTRP